MPHGFPVFSGCNMAVKRTEEDQCLRSEHPAVLLQIIITAGTVKHFQRKRKITGLLSQNSPRHLKPAFPLIAPQNLIKLMQRFALLRRQAIVFQIVIL